MVNDTDPLEQFHEWFDRAKMPFGPLDGATLYTTAREAFFAGYAARPVEPRLPSREALTNDRRRELRNKYAPPKPYNGPGDLEFREHGRHVLAGPSEDTLRRVQEGLAGKEKMPRPLPPTDQRAEKAAALRAAYGGPADTREDTMLFPRIEPGKQVHFIPPKTPFVSFVHTESVYRGDLPPDYIQHGTVTGRIPREPQPMDIRPHFEREPYVVDADPVRPGSVGDYVADHYGPPGPVPTPVDPEDG